jgi:hypothetical protein
LNTLPDECNECAEHKEGSACSSEEVIHAISKFVIRTNANKEQINEDDNTLPENNDIASKLVRKAAKKLNCESESCVLSSKEFRAVVKDVISPERLDIELETRFKTEGPRLTTDLLNNYNLDETLQRWAVTFKGFYPCPFAMMDFSTNGDLFGTISMADCLYGKQSAYFGKVLGDITTTFDTLGCVVNTDTSSGKGKHWVAVFVDCRDSKKWTIEYFNSAGRPPTKEITKWMAKQKHILEDYIEENKLNIDVETIAVTDLEHQDSKTECGMYALFYIRSRLEGKSYELFFRHLVPDSEMYEFRRHVFRAS